MIIEKHVVGSGFNGATNWGNSKNHLLYKIIKRLYRMVKTMEKMYNTGYMAQRKPLVGNF
jgi:hypothetical protein